MYNYTGDPEALRAGSDKPRIFLNFACMHDASAMVDCTGTVQPIIRLFVFVANHVEFLR